jgi:lipopolysaccharide export system protein LptA
MNQAAYLATALLGAALLRAGPAAAQGIDLSHGGPIDVTARDGIDWIQSQQEVVARGDARAVRGTVTVTADQLIAHYRKKKTPANPAADAAGGPVKPAAAASGGQGTAMDDTSGTEVYRLDAVGHVHIFTATDQAWGDHAVYDMDQSVLVLTGHGLKLVTPQDVITSRDDMEYWSQTRVSVARGNAVVVTNDGRRISADTLVGYMTQSDQPAAAAKPKPSTPVPAGNATQDPLLSSGKLQRVEAFGNVDVRTATETVLGDRAVYVPDTGKARIVGHVRITRGENQVNGVAADVDLKSGISTLLSGPGERVAGMITPNQNQGAATGSSAGGKGAKPAQPGGATQGSTKPK